MKSNWANHKNLTISDQNRFRKIQFLGIKYWINLFLQEVIIDSILRLELF